MAKALRLNEQIRISPVRLIDQNNDQRGIVPTAEAQRMARDAGMDLVEVSPTERPPVCRIMDYGKFKYQQKKKLKAQTGHEIVIKEVRLRPKTDSHDLMIKIKKAKKFLDAGHKVQFTLQFRGRENAHKDIGFDIFDEIMREFAEIAKVERAPKTEGRRMGMVIAPIGKVVPPKQGKPEKSPKPAPADTPMPAASNQ